VVRAGRHAGRRLFHLDRQHDDRDDASGGVQLRHSALSGCHREPGAAQSDDPAGAFAEILVGAIVAAVLSFTHATIGSLFPTLPQAIRDLNVGIIALAANIVAMIVVSSVTRPRAIPAGAV
jgi:hypothetical protein